MISLLVSLLIACVVVGLVYWIVTLFPIPAPIKQVALAVCVLILLLWILNIVGLVGPTWNVRL